MQVRKQILSFVLVLLTPSLVLAKGAQYPTEAVCIPYHSLGGSHIALSIFINHSGPYDFMVDTGAQLTVVEPRLAAELDLRSQNSIGLITGINRSTVDVAKAALVQAGPVAVQDLTVAVVGLTQIQAVNPGVRGILGENFLGRFDLLLDYDHKIICLDQSRVLQKQLQGERVPVMEQPARYGYLAYTAPVLVSAYVQGSGKKGTVLRLDSGSNVPVLYKDPLGTPWWLQRSHARQGGAAGNGRALSFAPMPRTVVEIGSHTTREIAFLTPVSSEPPAIMAGEDGVLPTILFKRVFISYEDHFVMFDPQLQTNR